MGNFSPRGGKFPIVVGNFPIVAVNSPKMGEIYLILVVLGPNIGDLGPFEGNFTCNWSIFPVLWGISPWKGKIPLYTGKLLQY